MWQITETGPDSSRRNAPRLDQLPEERRWGVHVRGGRLPDGESVERVRKRVQRPRARLPHRRQRRKFAEHEGVQDGPLRLQDRDCRCKSTTYTPTYLPTYIHTYLGSNQFNILCRN